MLHNLITLGLIVFAFIAGYHIGRPDPATVASNQEYLSTLKAERNQLKAHNENLETTLSLVRKQIETDRVAYDQLQRMVEKSEEERLRIRRQIETQRKILERLKNRLDSS